MRPGLVGGRRQGGPGRWGTEAAGDDGGVGKPVAGLCPQGRRWSKGRGRGWLAEAVTDLGGTGGPVARFLGKKFGQQHVEVGQQAWTVARGRFGRSAHARTCVEANRPQSTRTGYATDWRAWLRFCTDADLPPAAVRSGTLVAFVEWCWLQPARPPKPARPPGRLTAPATIDRSLSGVVVTARRQLKLQLQ